MGNVAAVFDVDGTIVSIKTMFSFQDYWFERRGHPSEKERFEAEFSTLHNNGASREVLNRMYYRSFRGRNTQDVVDLGRQWFSNILATKKDLFHHQILERLREHQKTGASIAFLSGSFDGILRPLCELLSVDHLLCSQPEVIDGHYTGELIPPQTIGAGKATALRTFFDHFDISADQSFAYGDDRSDVGMLAMVGHPVAVIGDPGLAIHAKLNGWNVIQLDPVPSHEPA